MPDHVHQTGPMKRESFAAQIAKAAGGVLFLLAFLWAFFTLAGGFGWVDGWVYLGLLYGGHGIGALWLRAKNPDLLRHRSRIGPGTRPWDVALLGLFALAYLGSLFVAAAEVGERGAPGLPAWAQVLGAVLQVAAIAVLTLSMTVNPHFEKTARIQRERNHRVVSSGPYRFVRHPGYATLIFGWVTAPPLLLGSATAFLPAAVAAAALVLRTAFEDRLLRRELTGYEEYAASVRFRLLPGVW